ncbi:hypothetical protein [Variovorax sp. GB1P17]|uniref:hypothetical protein n=1 Tax=Variovorax sp. GB1P17 TaxID=3443740 RepID=UPI003F44F1AF
MTELLENLDLLRSPLLSLNELTISGVGYGSKAGEFPIERVVEVSLASIVKGQSFSREQGHVYRDGSSRELSLAEVIADVLEHGGVLHFGEEVSFKIEDGAVAGFAIYGPHLDAFQYITSQEHLVKEFGRPDVVEPNEAYGDLMGYFNFWNASQKLVAWDDWKKSICLINIGMKRSG